MSYIVQVFPEGKEVHQAHIKRRTWRAKQNENVAGPVTAKFVFHFFDSLRLGFAKEKVAGLFLFVD